MKLDLSEKFRLSFRTFRGRPHHFLHIPERRTQKGAHEIVATAVAKKKRKKESVKEGNCSKVIQYLGYKSRASAKRWDWKTGIVPWLLVTRVLGAKGNSLRHDITKMKREGTNEKYIFRSIFEVELNSFNFHLFCYTVSTIFIFPVLLLNSLSYQLSPKVLD